MKKTNDPTARRRQEPHASFNRRNFLRGLGACLTLPALESTIAPLARAAGPMSPYATTATGAPLRMAFMSFPNGAQQDNWWPTGAGRDFEFNRTMEPLTPLKDKLQVIAGLDHENATPGDDGAGDHARANATFLTGARARKTDGIDIFVGTSIDQAVAKEIGHLTRFPSLELSCDAVRKSGRCDSGYSCAYQYNLSWQSPTTPMAPEANPRLVFERLFGSGAPGERQANFERRQQTQKSILDFVLEDARSLQRELGGNDRDKLDEYLTGVRDIETRIERSEKFGDLPDPQSDAPAGIPEDYGQHMELMYDMLALAFQSDSTRVATLLLAGDGTNRAFPQIGIPEGHHYCTHHQNVEELRNKVAAIDYYYMKFFAKFLHKLDSIKDIDGNSVLHNSMIVYGCANSDGNRHTHNNLPVILAGSGGGTLNPGRYLRLCPTPMTNMFLSMADRVNVTDLERFGDSTGRLAAI